MKNLLILLPILTVIGAVETAAQDVKIARNAIKKRDFEQALEEYLLLYEKDSTKLEYNYRIGVCYLNTRIDKSKAVPYLERAAKMEDHDPNTLYLLGRAYHYDYRFDKAIETFIKFKEKGKGSEANLNNVDQQIKYCENAKELMKYPVDVEFSPLSENVNSLFRDYYPFVPEDESYLLFNSRRDERSAEKSNGKYYSNIYRSSVKNGNFQKATPLGHKVNSKGGNEEVVGLSAEGDQAILYMDDGKYGQGDLYLCEMSKKGIPKKPKVLPDVINSDRVEIAGSITPSKDAIYFASNREGGEGGIDLYVSRKLPNGDWSPAKNLGPEINTPHNEDFPNISPDGETIYFSSKGHTSMGGYDIFKAEWDPIKKRWNNVSNIGYPINTPQDNMNFRVSESGKYGYISAIRDKGPGNEDIYRVDFKSVAPRYSVMKGIMASSDTTKALKRPRISVIDRSTGELFGNYVPNQETKRYVIILPPGKYLLTAEAPGFKPYEKSFEVHDKGSYRSMIPKDIKLTPKGAKNKKDKGGKK
ncbi:MAG: hypothetical protein ABEH38_06040 [Flavobacteriales bacterium]